MTEGHLEGLKSLLPGIEDPVSTSEGQDGGIIQPSAPLVKQSINQYFQGKTSGHQRMTLTPLPNHLPPRDLQPPASGPQQSPQQSTVLLEHLTPQNSEDLLFQGQQQQQSERDRMSANLSN